MLSGLIVPDYSKYDVLSATNTTVYWTDHKSGNIFTDFKLFLVEVFHQIERWDVIVHGFIFHEHLKPVLLGFMKAEGFEDTIWGSKIIFANDLPEDQVFAFYIPMADEIVTDSRYISMGILPCKNLNKMYELKAFW